MGGGAEIELHTVGAVAVITLNRPDNMNAVTTSMCDQLIAAIDSTDADDRVRAVVITGAGRAFCAGADLSGGNGSFDRAADEQGSAPRDSAGLVTLRLYRSLKPVIGAINGAAVGFGASIILPMDFRVAAEGAKIGYPFTARGIVPDGATSWFLPRIVGINRALDWTLTGRIFRSEEALDAGLVHSVHPADEVLGAALEIGDLIARDAAPVSVALTRQLMWQMLGEPHPMAAHQIESAALLHTGTAADAREGVGAFLEKRSPVWTLKPSTDLPSWFPWSAEPPYDGELPGGEPTTRARTT